MNVELNSLLQNIKESRTNLDNLVLSNKMDYDHILKQLKELQNNIKNVQSIIKIKKDLEEKNKTENK